jgi:hypothetical protein
MVHTILKKYSTEMADLRKKGATGRSERLERWINDKQANIQKKEDDRVKVLIGAAVAEAIKNGYPVHFDNPEDLIKALQSFLIRPQERLAILGDSNQGSASFWRCMGVTEA